MQAEVARKLMAIDRGCGGGAKVAEMEVRWLHTNCSTKCVSECWLSFGLWVCSAAGWEWWLLVA